MWARVSVSRQLFISHLPVIRLPLYLRLLCQPFPCQDTVARKTYLPLIIMSSYL